MIRPRRWVVERTSRPDAATPRHVPSGVRVRHRVPRLAALGALALAVSLWGLWVSGVLFVGAPPPPATQIAAVASADSWALAGRDVAHTSALRAHGGFAGHEAWRLDLSGPLRAAPSVVGRQLFLGAGDGRLLALDALTGRILWERTLSAPTSAAPAVTADTLYLTLRDGRLMALDREIGGEVWSFRGGSGFSAAPVVHRGTVYAGSRGGTLYAVDAQNGRQRWTFQAEGSIVASPAIQGDLAALAVDRGLVSVIDLTTGRKRLVLDIAHALRESPVFAGERLLIGTGRGRLWGIDWTEIEYPFERAFRYWRQQFFIWRMQAAPPTPKGLVWGRTLARGRALSAPAVLDGTAYVASHDGWLRAVSVADGEQVWEYDAGTEIRTAPAVAGGFVYVGTDAGDVHVVARSAGEAVRTIPVGVPLAGPIVLTGNGLYVTSRDPAVLVALR